MLRFSMLKSGFSLAALTLALTSLSSLTAQASHIFFTDVSANGVALDPDNAVVTTDAAGNIKFFVRAFGSKDNLNLTFTQNSGTNSLVLASQTFAIPSSSFPVGFAPYPAGTANEYTFVRAFNGTFTGTLFGDIPTSAPDYIAPGESPKTATQNTHTFSFSVRPAATPEPGSLALLVGLGVSGAGFLARRRQRARQAV